MVSSEMNGKPKTLAKQCIDDFLMLSDNMIVADEPGFEEDIDVLMVADEPEFFMNQARSYLR